MITLTHTAARRVLCTCASLAEPHSFHACLSPLPPSTSRLECRMSLSHQSQCMRVAEFLSSAGSRLRGAVHCQRPQRRMDRASASGAATRDRYWLWRWWCAFWTHTGSAPVGTHLPRHAAPCWRGNGCLRRHCDNWEPCHGPCTRSAAVSAVRPALCNSVMLLDAAFHLADAVWRIQAGRSGCCIAGRCLLTNTLAEPPVGACRACLKEGDVFAAAAALRDVHGPQNARGGNDILVAAAHLDDLSYASVYRCCDLALERQQAGQSQWLA